MKKKDGKQDEERKVERKVRFEINEATLWKAGTLVFALLFVLAWITDGFQGGTPSVQVAPSGAPSAGAGQAAPPAVVDASADDDPVKGDKDAPVQIIEFSDFQCPFCARFFSQTLPQLEKEYIDAGKANLVYRDLPLPFHPESQKAAESAECADDQGKFWEMHDTIFKNQQTMSVDNYKKWAAELGLDMETFNSCLDSGKHADEVKNDLADANSYGASGTPTFFINGKMLVGAQPFQAFKALIDQELAA